MKKSTSQEQANPVGIRQKTSSKIAAIASKFNNPEVTSTSKLQSNKNFIATNKNVLTFPFTFGSSSFETVKPVVTMPNIPFEVSKTSTSQRDIESGIQKLDIGSRCDSSSDLNRNKMYDIPEIDSENEYDFQSVVKENCYDKNEGDTVVDDWQDEKNFDSKLLRVSRLYNPRLTFGDVYDMDDDLLDKPYYFDISKEKATKLMSKIKKKGSYLVRPSENGEYVLMVLYEKNYVKKFKIQQFEDHWLLGVSNYSHTKFSTASELIDHYIKEGICCGNIQIKFISPVPRLKK